MTKFQSDLSFWPGMTEVRRVTLRLRAGVSGFEVESDLSTTEPLLVPTAALRALNSDAAGLLALRVRDQGMEPMFFEDDWLVINTADTALRNGEVYAVNWNGEACVQQLVKSGGHWYLNYVNSTFKPINVKSGQLGIVGRVVIQPTRVVAGRL
jgi:hypothetical protein